MTSTENMCPITASLDILGEKWTLLILRELFMGKGKFKELEQELACPRNLLSARLKKLTEADVIRTEDYKEPGARSRKAYLLTPKGLALAPVLIALQDWGSAHLAGTNQQFHLQHKECSTPVHVGFICAEGHVTPLDSLQVVTPEHTTD